MKKTLAIFLCLSLLLALPGTAAADGRSIECGGVMLTVTGYCTTPGADGAPRLTLFLSAGNKNDAPRAVYADGCVIGPCELPVNLSLTLDAWESREAMLVIPLTALSFFDLTDYPLDAIRLFLPVAAPGDTPFPAEPLVLRTGPLTKPAPQASTEETLFSRFGARVLTLGSVFDGRFCTVWFLLENNNDFPLRLDGGAEGAAFSGCTAREHSRTAFRLDFPAERLAGGHSFSLRCSLAGCADGPEKPVVPMASFAASLRLAEDGTLTTDGVASENDQSYIARVGMRDFQYDECTPGFDIDPDAPVLSARESGLVSLACCGGYEILAGPETTEGTRMRLPLTLRSFTDEALSLRPAPGAEGLSLPCLTAAATEAPANGSAETAFIFDAGGLAYTELAGAGELSHSFALSVGPASDPARSYGTHPAEGLCAVDDLEAREPCDFAETEAGAFSFRLLGLDLTDGLSVWLSVRNNGGEALPFGQARVEGMLNSSVVSFVNSGTLLPAGADCLVLLRAADFADEGTVDPFGFLLPPLSELNTLKLRLGPEEDARNVTVMFQHNGNIMLAGSSIANLSVPEE